MEIEGWSQTLTAGPLLAIAAGAIVVLLVLIVRFKMHAFPALILVSLLTAVATGIPLGQVVKVMTNGFGTTLGSVALLVGLGAMLGALLEVSGGAQVLAHKMISVFGEDRAPLALGVASLLFGFPIFFDAGLVVMLPVVFSVARWVGGSMLFYGLPAVGAFSVMHVFVPPHPGPVTAATLFSANVGTVLLVAALVILFNILADLAAAHDAWLHVDAAYGGGLLVSLRRRHLLAGIERADSVTVDFHKTFFQPVSSSAIVVRDGATLAHVTHHADYLNPRTAVTPNQVDKSLQTTRRFDALKLWMTLRTMGPDLLGRYVDTVVELAAEDEPALDLAPVGAEHVPGEGEGIGAG